MKKTMITVMVMVFAVAAFAQTSAPKDTTNATQPKPPVLHHGGHDFELTKSTPDADYVHNRFGARMDSQLLGGSVVRDSITVHPSKGESLQKHPDYLHPDTVHYAYDGWEANVRNGIGPEPNLTNVHRSITGKILPAGENNNDIMSTEFARKEISPNDVVIGTAATVRDGRTHTHILHVQQPNDSTQVTTRVYLHERKDKTNADLGAKLQQQIEAAANMNAPMIKKEGYYK